MNSSPVARVRQGGALALLGVLTVALFTALLALAPTTPTADAAEGAGCYDEAPRFTASLATTDCCPDDFSDLEFLNSGCDDEPTAPEPAVTAAPPTPEPTTPPPAATAAPTAAPTPVPTAIAPAAPAPTPAPPPSPIIGPITTGPIKGFLSAQLVGRQLTIDVPGDLAVQLQPAVYINAGGTFHAGPLPTNGKVTLTVRDGSSPITIVLKGVVWTGASYTETLVVPR